MKKKKTGHERNEQATKKQSLQSTSINDDPKIISYNEKMAADEENKESLKVAEDQ